MIVKTCTTCLSTFLLSAILLVAANATAFSQSASGAPPTLAAQKSAEALFEDALLLFGTDQRETVRARLRQAIGGWAAQRAPEKAARAALQMGDRYKQIDDYREALYYYDLALEVEALPDALRAAAWNAQALVYAELYETQVAAPKFEQALELARHTHDLPAQTLALTGLANLYHRQGEPAKALGYADEARHLNHQKDAATEAALLSLIGQIRLEEGLLKEAKGTFEEALAIYEKACDTAGQSRVLGTLSTLSLRAGQKAAALEQAERAFELSEQLRLRADAYEMRADNPRDRALSRADYQDVWRLQWPVRLSLARAARAVGDKEKARKAYLIATGNVMGLVIGWGLTNASESSAIALLEEAQVAYREYVDLLMEMGRFTDAYENADSAKGQLTLYRIAKRRKSPPPISGEQPAGLAQRTQAITALRLQLLDPSLSPERQAPLQRAIEAAEADIQAMRLRSELQHSRDYRVWSAPANVEEMQKLTAQGQPALAEFLLGEDRSYIWLFSRGHFLHATLPPRRQIEQAVRDYLALLTNPPGALSIDRDIAKIRERGATLFNMLFGTLAEQLEPGQPLIIVADGLLHYLPFGALVHGGHYLIQDHDTIYNPSASILRLWQASAPRVGGPPMELLAIGDPVFAPEAITGGAKKPFIASNSRAQQRAAAAGSPFASLPRTRDEVEDIANLFPAARRKVLLGREGTEAAFKREVAGHYRRLHFATHSWIDEKQPWHSAVVLTPGDAEDGLLDVNEISRLDLDCDLVVVSACQTGRGQLLSGEGIIGLSRAFLCAGARTVVVSLWNVSDNSTSQLMKDFYARLTGGLSNAAALREAKLRMLGSNKVTRHPYYWASFIMVGKP
ncbi:MAG TPA: CHAT domain-containing protein [Blastocatellia bacterium]|nr:CHAT domain-containing protein [Blastocatellia bacterium]